MPLDVVARTRHALIGAALAVVALALVVVIALATRGGDPWHQSSTGRTEIAPCLIAERVDVTGPGAGRVVLEVPGDNTVEGPFTVSPDGDWTFVADAVDAVAGSTDIGDDHITGGLTSIDGVIESTMVITLADHPQLVEGWDQTSLLRLPYDHETCPDAIAPRPAAIALSGLALPQQRDDSDRGLSGTIDIVIDDDHGHLELTGVLESDGTYELDAEGTVNFAGREIPISGTYSGQRNGDEWTIDGLLDSIELDGMVITDGRIGLREGIPGFDGEMTLTTDDQLELDVLLDYDDADDWTLTATGTAGTWNPSALPGVSLDTATLSGTVVSTDGDIDWSLTGEATAQLYGANVSVDMAIDDVDALTLTATGASGTISTDSGNILTTDASGTVDVTPTGTSGDITIDVVGDDLFDLGDGWSSNAALDLTWTSAPATIELDLTIDASAGDDQISLIGDWSPSNYTLDAIGTATFGSASGTFTGDYASSAEGTEWSISAAISDAEIATGLDITEATFAASSDRPGFTGSATLDIGGGSVSADVDWDDGDDWTLDLTADGTSWSPSAFPAMSIAAGTFDGTISSTGGAIDWAVGAADASFTLTDGIDVSGDITLSNRCTVSTWCPDDTGVYLELSSVNVDVDEAGVPDVAAVGALDVDGSWARLDATTDQVTFAGMGVSEPVLTIWTGSRSDIPVDGLTMPDLSGSTDGLGVEFCGEWSVSIPNVTTVATDGCIGWTPDGIVMGQVATGATVDSGSTNGLTLGPTSINGWALSTLASQNPVITLDGVRVALDEGVNTITGAITAPGNLMAAISDSSDASSMTAIGWYDDGDFEFSGSIEVGGPDGISAQGMTLNALTVDIGKAGDEFSFEIGADGQIEISGTRFPISADVGIEAGTTTTVYVSVGATGVRTELSSGSFDAPTLLPSGSFEPDDDSSIPGDFDTDLPPQLLTDGGFEYGRSDPSSLDNGDFETGAGENPVLGGDFEDGDWLNLLDNPGFEDGVNRVPEGDFEGLTTPDTDFWGVTSNVFSMSIVTDGVDTLDDPGSAALKITSRTSSASVGTGAYIANIGGSQSAAERYRITFSAKTPDARGVVITRFNQHKDCNDLNTDDYFTTQNTEWTTITFESAIRNCDRLALTITPPANGSVIVDNIEIVPISGSGNDTIIGNNIGNINGEFSFYTQPSSTRLDTNIPIGTNLAPFGDAHYTTKKKDKNARYWSELGTAPCPSPCTGNTYAWSVWLRSDKGIGGTLRLLAPAANGAPDQYVDLNWTATDEWTRHTVMMTVTDSRYDDLYAMAYVGSKDAWVDFDEMVLQQVPWRPYSTGEIARVAYNGDSTAQPYVSPTSAVTTDDGTSFMVIGDTSQPGFVRQYLDVTPVVGATYTFNAKVRSFGPYSGAEHYLQVVTRKNSGGPDVQDKKHWFSSTDEWTTQSLTFTVTDPADSIQLRIRATSGLAVDDVSLTGTPLIIDQPSDRTGWAVVDDGNISIDTLDDPTNAHSGSASLVLNSASSGSTAQRATGITPTTGSVHRLSGWIRSTSTVTVELLAGSSGSGDKASVTAGGGGDWEQFSVDLEVNGDSPGEFHILATPAATGVEVRLDDLEIIQVGLAPSDPWTTDSFGGDAYALITEDDTAHGGDGYLVVDAVDAAGAAHLDVALDGSGRPLTMGAWFRSGVEGSTPINLSITDDTGASRTVSAAVGDDWASSSIMFTPSPSATSATITIGVTAADSSVHVDDLTIAYLGNWTPTSADIDAFVITDDDPESGAHDGTGFLRLRATASGAGLSVASDEAPLATTTYTAGAWVRSPEGGTVSGRLQIMPTSGGGRATTQAFTATSEWNYVSVDLVDGSSPPAGLVVAVLVDTPGVALDVDTVQLAGSVFTPSDPWTYTASQGASAIALLRRDDTNAHSGDGYLDLAHNGVVNAHHDIATSLTPGDVITLTAWVRGVSGDTSGTFELSTLGGHTEKATAPFVAGSDWSQVTLRLTIDKSGHSGLRAALITGAGNGEILVDDVVVQPAEWEPLGAASTEQRNDAGLAQSGTGYLRITTPSSSDDNVGASLDADFAVDGETSKVLTMYVRAPDGQSVDGRLKLRFTGDTKVKAITAFTADDTWSPVVVELDVGDGDFDTMSSIVLVDTPGGELWIDTVSVQPGPLGDNNDANATLDHPESGYEYLWDDAFGIPGAHLWSISGEVSVTNGSPGLGVAATMYLDPTRMSALTGTGWIRGDLALNISYTEPCFAFGFEGSDGSGVSVGNGAFNATEFQLAIAPRGCTVGDVSLPIGASLSFEASIGSATFDLAMAIGVDDDGLPYFSYDSLLDDMVIAGTTYDDMRLTIYQSATESDASMSGSFTLPIGRASADLELAAGAEGVNMAGDVTLLDWSLASDAFTIDEMSFTWLIDVPADGSCAPTIETSATGDLTMGGNSLNFDGAIAFDCGVLKTFYVDVDVQRSTGAEYTLRVSYDSDTHIFSGDLEWSFKRKNSFKVAGIKVSRRAKVSIEMSLWVDFDKPSSARFTFDGRISVPSGGGEVACTLAKSNMSCDVEFWVNFAGKHTYKGGW